MSSAGSSAVSLAGSSAQSQAGSSALRFSSRRVRLVAGASLAACAAGRVRGPGSRSPFGCRSISLRRHARRAAPSPPYDPHPPTADSPRHSRPYEVPIAPDATSLCLATRLHADARPHDGCRTRHEARPIAPDATSPALRPGARRPRPHDGTAHTPRGTPHRARRNIACLMPRRPPIPARTTAQPTHHEALPIAPDATSRDSSSDSTTACSPEPPTPHPPDPQPPGPLQQALAAGVDDAGVEPGDVEAAGEAGVLDLEAPVHHHVEPAGPARCSAASSLHSPSWAQKTWAPIGTASAATAGRSDDPPEHVDDVGTPGQVGEGRVHRLAEDLALVRVHEPHRVVGLEPSRYVATK